MSSSIFNTSALTTAWSDHQREMRLETHASILYDSLYTEISDNCSIHYNSLMSKCTKARKKVDLSTPVWEYTTRYFVGDSEDSSQNDRAISRGLHWMVGTVEKPYNTMPGPVNPLSVHVVLRNTDVLPRLAVSIFGGTHYDLVIRRKASYVDPFLDMEIVTRQVMLRFHPNGLSDQTQAYHRVVQRRPHVAYACPDWCIASVLNGKEQLWFMSVPPPIRRGTKRRLSFDDADMPAPV